MKNQDVSRRDFLKTGALGTAALATGCQVFRSSPYRAHGIPLAELGQTGVRVPRIAIGLGSRFCSIAKEEEALEMLHYALDHGMYYWDTAYNYQNKKLGFTSEERLGKVLKDRRAEVFLATKVGAREPDEARQQIERSLKRLQTDRLDLLQIHAIRSMEDAEQLEPVVKVLREMKEQGVARFIGFSGHDSAEAMKTVAERYGLDHMLIALNHWRQGKQAFEEQAVPAARAKGLGVRVMKVVRPRETVKSLQVKDLIRYALSLEHADGTVIGMDSLEVLKTNIALQKNFQPMTEAEMKDMSLSLAPFYQNPNIPWMQPGYQDGNWA